MLVRLGVSPWHVVAAGAAGVLVWVSAIDLEHRLLPDRIVLPAAVIVLAAAAATGHGTGHAAAALAAGLALGIAVVLQPRSLGMGDAKLALLLGALLGGAVLHALAIGFCAVAVAALVVVAREGRAGMKRHLPLGPFLTLGALAVLLLGSV